MKLLTLLAEGWRSLPQESKQEIVEQLVPSTVLRAVVLNLDERAQEHYADDDTVDEDAEDIIDADFVDIKKGFGA